jgi:hypothetical protein
VFATGTPISNALSEMYTMQRYLQTPLLRQRGVEDFDAWAGTFAEPVTKLEIAPDGSGARTKTRLARYNNVGELAQMFRSVTDVQSNEDLKLPRPELATGKMQVVSAPATPALKMFVADLVRRAKLVKEKKVDPTEDNFLKITTHGRNAALDMRLVDPTAQDDPRSKLNQAADKIAEVYHRTSDVKGTQLVFSDLSTPGSDPSKSLGGVPNWNAYDHVKAKLIAAGVPAKEIRFMHEATTDEKKKKMFSDVRSGRVRILLGSTEKMGAGTNVQDRLVALHHLDAPWRPSDVEQRNGRILRQGNLLYNTGKIPHVEIFSYVTEGSFDAYIWQTLERKQDFIQQALKAGPGMRQIDDEGDIEVDFATAKAIASGNPKVMEKAQVDTEVARLARLQAAHADEQFRVRAELQKLPAQIKELRPLAAQTAEDAARIVETDGEKFAVTLGGKTLTKRPEAGQALQAAVQKQWKATPTNFLEGQQETRLGTFGGFELAVTSRRNPLNNAAEVSLRLQGKTAVYHEVDENDSPASLVRQLEHMPSTFAARAAARQAELARTEKRLADMQERGNQPFEHKARLDALQQRQRELAAELEADARREESAASGAQDEESPVSYQRTGEGTVGAGFDRSLFKKLGANMYKGDLGVVALKEALQNAADSIRGMAGEGEVAIDYDEDTRTLTVKDTGRGMSPAVMETAFVDVGGSAKDSREASGGYGLAKVALFSRAQEIHARSVTEVPGTAAPRRLLGVAVGKTAPRKVVTTIEGSGHDWVDGTLRMTTEDAPAGEPTGTTLRLVFEEGTAAARFHMQAFLSRAVKYSRVPFAITGAGQIRIYESALATRKEPMRTVEVPGATVTFYESEARRATGGWVGSQLEVAILNRGLYQFEQTRYGIDGDGLPEAVVVDVSPTVDVEHEDYPFTTSREELKKGAADAVDAFLRDIRQMGGQREVGDPDARARGRAADHGRPGLSRGRRPCGLPVGAGRPHRRRALCGGAVRGGAGHGRPDDAPHAAGAGPAGVRRHRALAPVPGRQHRPAWAEPAARERGDGGGPRPRRGGQHDPPQPVHHLRGGRRPSTPRRRAARGGCQHASDPPAGCRAAARARGADGGTDVGHYVARGRAPGGARAR